MQKHIKNDSETQMNPRVSSRMNILIRIQNKATRAAKKITKSFSVKNNNGSQIDTTVEHWMIPPTSETEF